MSHAYHVVTTLILFSFQASLALGIPSFVLHRQSPYIARQFKWLYFLFGVVVFLFVMSIMLFFLFQHCPICGFDVFHF